VLDGLGVELKTATMEELSLISVVPPTLGVDFISGDNTPAGGVLWAVALVTLAMSSRV